MRRRIHLLDPKTHEPSPEGKPAFFCPVCQCSHIADDRWKWNGDFDKPTLSSASPGSAFSYLTRSPVHTRSFWRLEREGKKGTKQYECEQDAKDAAVEARLGTEWYPQEVVSNREWKVICHTYIKDGMIKILTDSVRLGGQTIPLPEWEPSTWH